MTAEQFLSDLEAKAKNVIATQDLGWTQEWAFAEECFGDAANPVAMLRMIAMIHELSKGCDCDAEQCQYGHCTEECKLEMAYQKTEPK